MPSRRVRAKPWAALLATLLLSNQLMAESTSFICPIGGAAFSLDIPTAVAHTGQNLDFKLTGEKVTSPRPIPVCPDNGFVIYRQDFSDDEITSLSAYVLSDEYRALTDTHTPYFRLAKLLTFQGHAALEVAFAYLRASWEVDTEPERYAVYAQATASKLETYLLDADPKTPDFFTAHWLLAELKRRTGDFESARATLDAIKHHEQASKPYPSRMIILLYRLIGSENLAPHRMP